MAGENTVDVDPVAAAAALDQLAAANPDAAVPGEPVSNAQQLPGEAPNGPEAWRDGARVAVQLAHATMFPAWELSQDNADRLELALAGCLHQLLPGGMGNLEQWGPWGKLAFACGCVALANFDFSAMKLKASGRKVSDAIEATPAEPNKPAPAADTDGIKINPAE